MKKILKNFTIYFILCSIFINYFNTIPNSKKIVFANTISTTIETDNNLDENNDLSYEEVVNNIDYNNIKNYNEKQSRGIISAISKIFKAIPKKIKTDIEPFVDLTKFTNKKEKNKLFNNKTGWWIEKDTAGHGGGAYKLFDGNTKKRHATLDKDGKVLRD